MSVLESLTHAGLWHKVEPEIVWINAETVTPDELARTLRTVSGVVVPGGFGARGTEGKVAAARWARENRIPYLGLCYGLHMAVIDIARNVLGLSGANSTEIDPNTPYPVIDLMPDQKGVEMGGTMRLGCGRAVSSPERRAPRPTRYLRFPSATGTVSRSTTPSVAGLPPPGSSSAAPLPMVSSPRSWSWRPPLLRWGPVPPGVPFPSDQPPPTLPGLHRRRQGDPARGRPARATTRGRGRGRRRVVPRGPRARRDTRVDTYHPANFILRT